MLSAVFEHTRAKGAAWQVLISLADWADHHGYCYPSLSQIAQKTNLSRAVIPKAIRHLIELGELQHNPRGHQGGQPDDDDPKQIRCQTRNLYRILLVKPKRQVGNDVHHLSQFPPKASTKTLAEPQVVNDVDHLANAQVGNVGAPGSQRRDAEVGNVELAHKRNDPSGDPSGDPSAARGAAAAENLEAFRTGWNDAIQPPLTPVLALTRVRQNRIRLCLTEYPLERWLHEIFPRLARSGFCCGEGDRGFVASFDWLINDRGAATKVLEGRYDDTFSEAELAAAASHRFRVWGSGCAHRPVCESTEECNQRVARVLRRQKVSA